MTASTSDPVVPAKLARYEPVDITVTTDPTKTVITLLWEDGTWDTAVQEDVFNVRKFPGSSRAGSVFTINPPSGGWSQKFQPRVSEPPPGVTGALSMAPIYSVDLTAQPNLSMAAAGSYTIDGKTWWAKGAFPGGGTWTNEVVNGAGMRLGADSGASNGSWRAGGAGAYNARALSFPVGQLTEFNPDAPLAVLARFTYDALNGSESFAPWVGLGDADASSAALTSAERQTVASLLIYGSSNSWWMRAPYNATTEDNIGVSGLGTDMGNIPIGVYRFAKKRYYPLVASGWSGSLPDIDAAQEFSITATRATSGGAGSDTPCFLWAMEKNFGGSSRDAYLTHFQVLQPRVP